MKKAAIILIIIFAAIIIIGGFLACKYSLISNLMDKGNRENSEIAGWKTYTNDEYGFEIEYPADLHFVAGAALLKCPVDYCVGISHPRGVQDNRVFIFSMDIANRNLYEGNDNPFFNIKDYQEVLIGGQRALYSENKSEFNLDTGYLIHLAVKNYIIFKDGKTYQIVINIDGDNKDDNAMLDAMLSTFKFTK